MSKTATKRQALAVLPETRSGSSVLNRWVAENGPEYRRLHPASARRGKRLYAGASYGRTTADWIAASTSADAELYTSLRTLRNRSRQLIRDNEYAKNAARIIVNNVVGTGIQFQSQVMMRRGGRLDERTNDAVEKLWQHWSRAKRCHTAGRHSWNGLLRQVMRDVFESGEVLIRKVYQRFGDSKVPFALEVIEADQLVENWSGRTEGGNEVRMGVEVDAWQRPVAYWLYPRHPGDNFVNAGAAATTYIRVPADEIIHVAIFDRTYQTRGVPWLHSTLIKLRHMGGYEEAEIVRARGSAAIMGFIQSPEVDMPDPDDNEANDSDGVMDGDEVMDLSPGIIKKLAQGETFQGFNPSSPNAAIDPFMRFMLRSVAAGAGVSYESLSRDYSQSNYSSSRLALLDDRDLWKVLQQWLIELVCQDVFEAWQEAAVLSGALSLPAYETSSEIYTDVRWKPRGWSWIDPEKEGNAATKAVRSGLSTLTDELAAKGEDVEDVFKRRRVELDLAAQYGLVLDSDPAQVNDKGQAQAAAVPGETDTGLDETGNPKQASGADGNSQAPADAAQTTTDSEQDDTP